MAWLVGHALLDEQGQLHPLRGRQLLPVLIKLELLRMEGGAITLVPAQEAFPDPLVLPPLSKGNSDLGGLQGTDGHHDTAEHLPDCGTEAPLVSFQAKCPGLLETFRGHPGDPVSEHCGGGDGTKGHCLAPRGPSCLQPSALTLQA